MQITRSELDTTKGPADWFTGDVYVDTVVAAPAPARSQGGLVHFTLGARTAWHSHPLGQTIFVTEGVGRCQRRGGTIQEIRPGDRVFFEPDEEHWHGAAPNRLMTHLALTENPAEQPSTNWGHKSPSRNTESSTQSPSEPSAGKESGRYPPLRLARSCGSLGRRDRARRRCRSGRWSSEKPLRILAHQLVGGITVARTIDTVA